MENLINTRAFESLKRVMTHWGFNDTEAAIYALLALSRKQMTAKDLAEIIGRAYSSVVNELNKLIRYGLVERSKTNKCYEYSAVIDLIQILRRERAMVRRLLTEVKECLDKIDMENEEFKEHLEEAIEYLGKLDMEV